MRDSQSEIDNDATDDIQYYHWRMRSISSDTEKRRIITHFLGLRKAEECEVRTRVQEPRVNGTDHVEGHYASAVSYFATHADITDSLFKSSDKNT